MYVCMCVRVFNLVDAGAFAGTSDRFRSLCRINCEGVMPEKGRRVVIR